MGDRTQPPALGRVTRRGVLAGERILADESRDVISVAGEREHEVVGGELPREQAFEDWPACAVYKPTQ